MTPRRWTSLALAAALAGCVSAERYDAASDIRTFLIAVRDGDKATFDAHVDRPALKTNLKARLLAQAGERSGAASGGTFGALLAGPMVDVAVDALVRPEVFRAAASMAGYGPDTKIPGALVLGHGLQAMDEERVCAEVHKRCAFIFKNEAGVWRLIDYAGGLDMLEHRSAISNRLRG
jgi:hypothetical protein